MNRAALPGITSRMTRVLVLADSAIVRAGLEAMLRDSGRFQPVLRAGAQPDVILAESWRPPPEQPEGPPLVLLADDLSRGELIRALAGRVRAVLHREARAEEILAALEAAAAGLTTLGPDELDLLLPVGASAEADESVLDALSARESEVLALLARGLANKEIADRLGISEHTVKFHVSSILSKLGATSRTEAVTRGLRDGLLVI